MDRVACSFFCTDIYIYIYTDKRMSKESQIDFR